MKVTSKKAPYLGRYRGDIGRYRGEGDVEEGAVPSSNHVKKFRVRVRRLGGSGLGLDGAVLGSRVMHVQRHAHPRVCGVHRDEGAVIHRAAAQDAHPQRAWVRVRVRVAVRVRIRGTVRGRLIHSAPVTSGPCGVSLVTGGQTGSFFSKRPFFSGMKRPLTPAQKVGSVPLVRDP